MIKNIVFDMGNVLVRFDPELFMDRYSLTGEDRKLIRNEVFRSVEWTMLDRGVIDEEIAEQRILPRLPERLHDAARGLIEKWDDPIVPVEGMLELLQVLKAKGYRLYLLSNAATRQPIYWARAEASKLMDGALISAEVKLLKPDPQIYRTFLHKFALRPVSYTHLDVYKRQELVKKAAVEAVEAGKPVNLLFGTVISASPLKIQVDQKAIYTEKMLVLTRNVTDYEVDMTVSHQTVVITHGHPVRCV